MLSMLYADRRREEQWSLLRVPAVLGAVLLLVATGGCDTLSGQTDEEASFTTSVASQTLTNGSVNVDQIDNGQYGDIVEGTQTVLRDEEAYASFWNDLHADDSSVPNRPEVDFSQQVVLVIVLGARPTGGYNVEIDEVVASEDKDQIQVQFTENAPGDDCAVTQAKTSPYVLATAETQATDISFSGSETTYSCN